MIIVFEHTHRQPIHTPQQPNHINNSRRIQLMRAVTNPTKQKKIIFNENYQQIKRTATLFFLELLVFLFCVAGSPVRSPQNAALFKFTENI